ncbi:MFS transporter [Streptacidiphilus griseoplanus]|uniref:MFS transporter n=1 Tax=Peterkaempfera griseoplana TaxID=66896 RepID=UPI0006E1B87D|nr:MFS transporter [Peterkaempfera griseoplana]BCN13453.1 major facilitator superfamily (MFS) transporter [Peterkaempfera griseoplana]
MGRIHATAVRYFTGLPRSFWIVFAGQFVNRIGALAVPFLVLYLRDQGLSAADAGTVLAAMGLGGLLSQPLGGALSDRCGPRFTLVAGPSAAALGILALGAADGLPMLLATAALVGVLADVYRPAAAALVAEVVPSASRARAFSLIYWAVNLGVALAGLLAGLLARHGYRPLFLVQAATGAAFALLIAVALPPRRPPGEAPAPDGTAGRQPPAVLRDRVLLALIALNLLNGVVAAQIVLGVPLAVRDSGLDPTAYGAVLLTAGVLIAVAQPLLAAWLERFDRITVLSLSWLVFGAGMAATGLAGTLPQYLATVAVWTLGEIGAASFVGAIVADLAPPRAQGRYQAAFGWSYAAAQLAGPLAGASLYALAPWALWWTCAALGLLGAVGGLALTAPLRRRAAPHVPTRLLEEAL